MSLQAELSTPPSVSALLIKQRLLASILSLFGGGGGSQSWRNFPLLKWHTFRPRKNTFSNLRCGIQRQNEDSFCVQNRPSKFVFVNFAHTKRILLPRMDASIESFKTQRSDGEKEMGYLRSRVGGERSGPCSCQSSFCLSALL